MKIRMLSDLHLEFHDYRVAPMPDDKETVLVLEGDIGCIHGNREQYLKLCDFIGYCSSKFREVIWVMGNHEHYKGSLLLTKRNLGNRRFQSSQW